MLRDRARALSCCAAGSTIYFADMEPDELGSNHQDWTRLPLIGDASHLLNRGRTFLSAVCHALASRCLLLQEAMGGRMLQATLTAQMSVGALCVRSLCTLCMLFCDSIHACCEWERCESTRRLPARRHEQKRGLGRHMFSAFVFSASAAPRDLCILPGEQESKEGSKGRGASSAVCAELP